MRTLSSLLLLLVLAGPLSADEHDLTKSFDSPDGRFVLKASVPDQTAEEAKFEVVEKASGKVVGDLGTEYASLMSHMNVVWSADSKRLAYRGSGQREWSTNVFFWDGAEFKFIPLPEELPSPDIKFRKDETGGVKNYGGGNEPVRWLKSGDLELVSKETQMARDSGRTYTASMTITIHFDGQQHASVKSTSKAKTRVQ
jgi:hypothetical protein